LSNNISSAEKHFFSKRPVVITLSILVLILAALAVIWLNLSWRPDIYGTSPDSGFFAYFGKAILNGQVPYRDIWDNKPPFGYYINALALLVFGQSMWSIWWSGVLWILGCVVLFFVIIKKLMGVSAAAIGSVAFLLALMNPQIFGGGNMTEVYGLAPQIGIIGITYLFFTHPKKLLYAGLAGILTACAFLFKQTTIMLGFSSILVMLAGTISQRKIWETIKTGLSFFAGFVGLLGIVSLYWLFTGAMGPFFEGVFQGYFYIGGQGSGFGTNLFHTLTQILPHMYIGVLYLLALLAGAIFLIEKLYRFWIQPILKEGFKWIDGLLLGLIILFPIVCKLLDIPLSNRKLFVIVVFFLATYSLVKFYRLRSRPVNQQVFSALEWTYLAAVISLPLEALMASLGGRNFGHYFITMIPTIILSIAYPISKVASAFSSRSRSKRPILENAANLVLIFGVLVWGVFSLRKDIPSSVYLNNLAGIFSSHVQLSDLEQFIVDTTKPTDTVLVWHIHLGINFDTNRKAAARILFPLNLFIPASDTNSKLAEYIHELEDNPPELIVVQENSSIALPFVNVPIDEACQYFCTPEFEQALKVPQIYQEWLSLQQYFESHYALDRQIYDWNVYRKLP
jgi:4-amino-4-deoxy-L-arabinose transferase-like glycosyltransferase